MSLLTVKGLVKVYGERTVVDDVSFEVDEGEIVGLLGPNGAGKTTTFRMTVGMIKPDAGRVRFEGQDVTRMPMYKRARLGIGYLSQEPSIFRHLTVKENLLAVLEARGFGHDERTERTEELLDEFGIEQVAASIASTLSGGERRRLELARTLALEPRLILLDEPFSGVDPIAVEDIQELLFGLRNRGIGVLITDHAVRETLGTTDRAYIIYEGGIFRHGDTATLARDPKVKAVYLGETFSMERVEAPAARERVGRPGAKKRATERAARPAKSAPDTAPDIAPDIAPDTAPTTGSEKPSEDEILLTGDVEDTAEAPRQRNERSAQPLGTAGREAAAARRSESRRRAATRRKLARDGPNPPEPKEDDH